MARTVTIPLPPHGIPTGELAGRTYGLEPYRGWVVVAVDSDAGTLTLQEPTDGRTAN